MHRYVIMLDYLLRANPNHWPISASSDDLAEIKKVRQHDGAPFLEPRVNCSMDRKADISLILSRTGEANPGGIYETRATRDTVTRSLPIDS